MTLKHFALDMRINVWWSRLQDVWQIHQSAGVPLRVAAFMKALERVTQSTMARGFD
jgi:glutamate dehydrogenase/leucine dehydrogenase